VPDATASVTKNLALADLDELLRALLQRELETVPMTGVDITFDAPTRERTSTWRLPAVNLFLYDLREAAAPRDRSWHQRDDGSSAVLERSPLRLACTFSITAWTRDVVDEHQLLSQVLSVLLAYPVLPGSMLPPSLQIGSPPVGLSTRVGQAKEEGRADFWSAIGSPYKVSLEYMVTILCIAGQARERGRRVASTSVSELPGGPNGAAQGTLYAQGGTVLDPRGNGVSDAWVVLPKVGPWTTTGADGRFVFSAVPRGEHELLVRGADGATVTATLTVPGSAPVLTLADAA
jgi:Pvc16 N-terminal domain/Carboxypeptidase regulatory-like domain